MLALNTSYKWFRYISSLIIRYKNCYYTIFLNIYFTDYTETIIFNHNIDIHA
jgi:hypothetical protein